MNLSVLSNLLPAQADWDPLRVGKKIFINQNSDKISILFLRKIILSTY